MGARSWSSCRGSTSCGASTPSVRCLCIPPAAAGSGWGGCARAFLFLSGYAACQREDYWVWAEGEVEVQQLLARLGGGPCVRYPERLEENPGLAVGAGELQPGGRGSAGTTAWGIPSGGRTSRAGRGWCDGVMLRAVRQGSSSISPSAPAGGHRDALSGVPAQLGVTMVPPSPNGSGYMGL